MRGCADVSPRRREDPRACPHCGRHGDSSGAEGVLAGHGRRPLATIRCAACGTTFLNADQHKLLLGASLPIKGKPLPTADVAGVALVRRESNPASGRSPSKHAPSRRSAADVVERQAASNGSLPATPTVLVHRQHVFAAAEAQSGVAAGCLSCDPSWFRTLEARIRDAVYGQETAVRCACRYTARRHSADGGSASA